VRRADKKSIVQGNLHIGTGDLKVRVDTEDAYAKRVDFYKRCNVQQTMENASFSFCSIKEFSPEIMRDCDFYSGNRVGGVYLRTDDTALSR
jgi:hypothetical protein